MFSLDKLRSSLRARRYNAIARANRDEDRRVLADLGLLKYYSDDYATTGVSGGDIAFLHNYIKTHRPRRVIEFGTGKSTWVIAKCMERYCWDEYGGDIAFVSMEESQYWYDQQIKFLPKNEYQHFDKFVKIICSEIEMFQFRFAIGSSYTGTPIESFDFCFVDGPSPRNACNMDFVKLILSSDLPMTALIDNRKSTQMVYAALFGKDKLTRYHSGLCLLNGVSRADLKSTRYKDIFPENETILRL